MRGRPPKPTALKELEGFPGHRKPNANEPKPETIAPKCPHHVQGAARKEWRRISTELLALGLLTRIDMSSLASYCITYARWQEAEEQVSKGGLVVKTKSGNLIQNPYLGVANSAMKLCHKFAVEFGFTPSSRSRLNVTPTGGADELSDFLNDAPSPLRMAE